MKAYSEDLRRKIVEATERGTFKTRDARLFDVRISPVKRYARWRGEEVVAPKKGSGRSAKLGENAKTLPERRYLKERPAANVSDRRRFLERITGSGLSDSTVRRPRWRSARAARV